MTRSTTNRIFSGPAARCTNDELTLNFEGGSKTGWTQTGTAFDNQPTYGDNPSARSRGQPAKMEGSWWIGGYEDRPNAISKAGLLHRYRLRVVSSFPPGDR